MKVFRQLALVLLVFVAFLSGAALAQEAPQPQPTTIELLAKTVNDQQREIDTLRQEIAALRRYVGDPSQIAGTPKRAGIARDLGGAVQLLDRRDYDFKDRLILLEEWQIAVEGAKQPFSGDSLTTDEERKKAIYEHYQRIRLLEQAIRKMNAGGPGEPPTKEERETRIALMYRLIAQHYGEIQKIGYDAVRRSP